MNHEEWITVENRRKSRGRKKQDQPTPNISKPLHVHMRNKQVGLVARGASKMKHMSLKEPSRDIKNGNSIYGVTY